MSLELESILFGILEKRGIFSSPCCKSTICQACRRKEVEYERKLEPEKKYCSPLCNRAEYVIGKMFPLGMKRVREEIVIEDEDIFRWLELPTELQAHIILLAFDYRIDNLDEWEELMALNVLISKSNQLLIETQVIPLIQFIDSSVHSNFTEEQFVRFVGLRKLDTEYSYQRNWNRLIASMKELVDINSLRISGGEEDWIKIEKLPQLTRLVCLGRQVRDENLQGLTRLRTLSLHKSYDVSDECLSRLVNLQRLELMNMDGEKMIITANGLQSLSNLRKLILSRVYVIGSEFISQMTQLKSLSLRETFIDNLETLVNLESLRLASNGDGDGFTQETFRVLTNLTKLSLEPGYIYPGMVGMTLLKELHLGYTVGGWSDKSLELFRALAPNLKKLSLGNNEEIPNQALVLLTNLTHLSLPENVVITNQGLYKLTNLTFLDLRRNSTITTSILSRLKSLRRLQERDNRIYRIQNGTIINL